MAGRPMPRGPTAVLSGSSRARCAHPTLLAMHRWPVDSLRSLGAMLVAFVLLPALAAAQSNPAAQSARQWRQQHERAIVNELVTLLAVPNVSSDTPNIQRNAELIAKMIEARGLT